MTSSLELLTRVMRDQDIIAVGMDGETVMMSIDRGEYYGLSGIGPFIWDLLTEPMSIEELCEQVTKEYEVEELVCQTDVLTFVDDLLSKGVLRRAD